MRWVISIFLGLIAISGFTQQVKMYAYTHTDSLTLVWLPDGAEVWQKGIEKGFDLYRSRVMKDGILIPFNDRRASRQLIGSYKVLNQEDWLVSIDTSDQWEVLTYGMVYNELNAEPSRTDYKLGFMVDREIGEQKRYLFNLVSVSNSPIAMEKMGYKHQDSGLKDGDIYLYEIALSGSVEIMGEIIVQAGKKPAWRNIDDFSIENSQQGIQLDWVIHGEYINYSVFRSLDGLNWEEINESPIMTVEGVQEAAYLDQQVVNGHSYQYRIRGKTIFGLWGPYSDTKTVERVEQVEEGKLGFNSLISKETGCEIGWEYYGVVALNSLQLLFSETYEGPYNEIAFDVNPQPGLWDISNSINSGYLQLRGIDELNREVLSVKRLYNPIDITPPSPPIGLKCIVDTLSSRIILKWAASEESDLKGYRVYMSNQKNGNYVDVGQGVMDSTGWVMPVKYQTNGETLFFKLQSVDNRYNNSNLSETCSLLLPDRKPPSAPLVRKVMDKGNNLMIEWAISPSKDVVNHFLERMDESERQWKMLDMKKGDVEIRYYTDTTVLVQRTYSYRIGAKDRGGNVTFSEVKSGKIGGYNYPSGIETLHAVENDGQLELTWQSVPPGALNRIILYRAIDDNGWITYRVFNQESLRRMVEYSNGIWKYSFIDDSVNKSHRYRYSIRQVWQDGRTSRRSREVKIAIE